MATTQITLTSTWTQHANVDEYVHLQVQGSFFYIYNSSTPDPEDQGYLAEANSASGWAIIIGSALDNLWVKSVSTDSQIGILTVKTP